jgi:hypothetical protein
MPTFGQEIICVKLCPLLLYFEDGIGVYLTKIIKSYASAVISAEYSKD